MLLSSALLHSDDVSVLIEVSDRVSETVFFVVTVMTESFEIVGIETDRRIIHVERVQIYFVMTDCRRSSAPLTNIILTRHV